MSKTDNVIQIPTLANDTPERVISDVLERAKSGDITDVIVIGYDKSESLVIRSSSEITRKDALWMIESVKADIFGW